MVLMSFVVKFCNPNSKHLDSDKDEKGGEDLSKNPSTEHWKMQNT